MSKILVTGAAGFIGSHLVETCLEQGFSVVAFDQYNPNNNWGWLEAFGHRDDMEIILGEIRDYDSVYRAMEGCDMVFHLAALVGIPYSYISPLAYIRTNVEGVYNVLEASRNRQVDQILITSTSETYGTAQYVPMDEGHPLVGQSPYAASKIAADQLAISYHRSFDLPVKIVRPFNTYGGRQSTRASIPTIIMQCLQGQPEVLLGNLSPTRDLTYVQDVCRGFLEVSLSDNLFGEATNIGMNQEISIGDLAALVAEIMEMEISVRQDIKRIRPEKSEVGRLSCDNSKLLNNTDWHPKYDLRSGLKETIEWYRNYGYLYKADLYNV